MLNQSNVFNAETWVGNLISKNTENINIKILFLIITVFFWEFVTNCFCKN